jgi:hypothetical protein
MTITPTRGNGSGTVSYTAEVNTGALRSAQIKVAGNSFMVSQLPARCTYSISPDNRTALPGGKTYSSSVYASREGCEWSASESVDWISISPTSGTGDGTVSCRVFPLAGTSRMTAIITVAGKSHA